MQPLLSQDLARSVEQVMAQRRASMRPGMDVYWYERDTIMVIIVLLGMTIVLQLMAAVLALRLIRITAKRTGWVLLALAVVLLALQRCLFFLRVTAGEAPLPPLLLAVLGLGIAVCLVAGIAWIAPLFVSLRHAGEAMQQASEAELQKQRAEYEMIFHAVPVELRFKDANNRLIRVNDAAAEADGYTVAELEGKSCWDLYPQELAARYYADDLEVIRTGTPKRHFVMPHPTASGTLRWVEVNKLPCRDRDGTISGVLVVAMDITERQRAEEALAVRIAQMEAVRTVAEEITRELALPTLLQLIIRRAMDLLHADNSTIYLWDEATRTVMPRAWCNVGEWISEVRLRLGEGVVGTVAQRREGMIVNEYQQSSYALHAYLPYLGQSAIVAEPLLYHDRLVGVLLVAHAQPGRHFTPQDRELLTVLAAQAAVAIENARLFEESAQRQAWLSSILEMNKRIAMSEDMPSLLSRIATEAARLVGAEGANLRILQGDRLVTTSQTQYGLVLPDVPALQLGEGVAGLAARDNRILVVPDLQTHPDIPAFIKAQAAKVGLHSMVSIPIRSRNSVIGVLSVNAARPRVFTEDESAALAICAEQAAIAIENARLFEDSTRRQAWLATILDINKRIAAHEDMASLLAQIAEEAKRLIGADGAILRLLRGDQLVAVGATPYGPTAADAPETRLGEGIVGRAALEQRVFMVPDVQAHADIAPFRKQRAAEVGINAMLCVPFCGRRQILGVLSITSSQRRVFTDDEALVLSAYAEQVAIAIEHARLLAAEEERTAVLERTNLILRNEITERQRVEAERERLIAEQEAKNAEMERFTYTVSHDLKSPLITICGFLGLLEQDALRGNVERMQTDIAYIHMAATTMQRLLDELLELSRIGRVVHPLTEIPLSALAHEAVTLVGGQIAARGVQVHIAPALPVVVGDRSRLLEVLQNLVDNAVKFMGTQPSPRIEIGCRQEEKETVYYVQDNGVGIEPRYHEKVFGLFERLESEGDGTGIGLALVKRIIEVHGGRIWVESAGQGCGSTFCFTLSPQ
jgi:PAS domain S-box-containing protein